MKTDTLFYRLFQAWPEVVFELAGLEGLDGRDYRFRSEEVKQTAFRLERLLELPETNLEGPVVFVEVQMQAEDKFYGRFFAEILLYLYRCLSPHPWRVLVIYPTLGPRGNQGDVGLGYRIETDPVLSGGVRRR